MNMPLLWLLLLFLLVPDNYSQPTTQIPTARTDRVIVQPRTIVIVRSGKIARDFPAKRRATIRFPVISGLADARVLRQVQTILQIKNVFETSVAEYRENNWLEEFDYKVNYNKNHILDLTFSQSGSGAYPDSQNKHFAINLKTGTIIKAADAFVPNKLVSVADLVKAKFQAELAQILKDLAESKSDPEDIRIAKEAQDALEFKISDIDDFSIGDKGITFLYDAGYPHAIQAFEPKGEYFFSYSELRAYIKRDGPLGQFVQ
jgi:hypothetical protein